MKTVTYEQFLEFKPCWLEDGRAEKLAKIGARKQDWTAVDVLKLRSVSMEDRLWAVLREEFLPATILHEFACRCAERALKKAKVTDERSWNAIKVKRAWLKGEATDEELAAARAAAAAAWAAGAAGAAAWAAWAAGAAWAVAAWVAAWAARDTAAAAERKLQVADLLALCEEE